MDLTTAVVILSSSLLQNDSMAGTMLVEEVETRTEIRWQIETGWPNGSQPVIWIGTQSDLSDIPKAIARQLPAESSDRQPEGFTIKVMAEAAKPSLLVVGNDSRGALFGVGYLLRKMEMSRHRIGVTDDLQIETAPEYSLRGHQLGYRNTPNSYDAWDLGQWERYYRDLIVFGTNAIELVSDSTNDIVDSPLFPLPPLEMATGMSALAEKYDLDVWLWYPALEGDYSDPTVVERHLEKSETFLKSLSRLDHLFVPGGDPGETEPSILIPLLKKKYDQLQKIHPGAGLWVSPQGFGNQWLQYFIQWIESEKPAWLAGLVYGPGIRMSLHDFRTAIPDNYPVRSYPDITHTFHCQYPVPKWDRAFALTEGREPINPRPEDQKIIFNFERKDTFGWLTYSEGCNDDVNKIVWSSLAWNPDIPLSEILDDYARYFIGSEFSDSFSSGISALEKNWRGPLLSNEKVPDTLRLFQTIERKSGAKLLDNWRFQMALYRANYDAFLYNRLIHETGIEAEAYHELAQAPGIGSLQAMDRAVKKLSLSKVDPLIKELRSRVFELGDALFRSIGMQLSVEKYQAKMINRGANLDTIDFPLNNARWLMAQFADIRTLRNEGERLLRIRELIHWTDPGLGGYYDDLGNSGLEPHLVRGPGFESDPGVLHSPADDFELIKDLDFYERHPYRYSWLSRASTIHGTPLRLRYSKLDRGAQYRVRIVYPADRDDFVPKIRLTTEEGLEIHRFMDRPVPARPLEFAVPQTATSDGKLELILNREPTEQGNGRGAQMAEVWLLRDM